MPARLVIPLFALLAACGQTGPLYLPEEPIDTEVEIRPAPTTREAPPGEDPAEPEDERAAPQDPPAE